MVRRARAGDADAFGELVARCSVSAHRVATVVLGTVVGADDVVQDATLRVWRSIEGVDPMRGFRSWYLRAVANTARNHRRGRGRRAALNLRAEHEPKAQAPGPEDRAVTASERDCVLSALNALGERDRLVVALRYFEQLTEAEMASVLDCAPGTVKSRLSRALKRLRAELPSVGGVGV